jgi:Fe-S cluster biogenesis protein NfuA
VSADPSAEAPHPRDAHETAARVDRLLDQLRHGPDPRAAAVAEELARCLVRLYGAGLARALTIAGPRVTADLCADPLVESLLLVHDLHPLDVDTRIRRALDRIGPHAAYEGVDEHGVARVRLTGGGHGCRASVRAAVESAVRAAAPDVTGVVVTVDPEPPPLLTITRRPAEVVAP